MRAEYVGGGLGREPLGLRPGVVYPFMLMLVEPGGFWASACTADKRGSMWRAGYREVQR